MTQERFDRLEQPGSTSLPSEIETVIAHFDRFDHLEIGQLPSVDKTPIEASTSSEGRILCGHCGQPNEPEREVCWACYKPVKISAPALAPEPASDGAQELTLVIDGHTYKSSDKDLPEEIAVLIGRIRKQGYSQELLAEWRGWRATRNVQVQPELLPEGLVGKLPGVEAFQGSRVSVIRLDGKVYKSDDKGLSPELGKLFSYIDQFGVTPELMERLRQLGSKVKWRPNTTAAPSEGDLSFWNEAQPPAP